LEQDLVAAYIHLPTYNFSYYSGKQLVVGLVDQWVGSCSTSITSYTEVHAGSLPVGLHAVMSQ